jgi:hypothetical protein
MKFRKSSKIERWPEKSKDARAFLGDQMQNARIPGETDHT